MTPGGGLAASMVMLAELDAWGMVTFARFLEQACRSAHGQNCTVDAWMIMEQWTSAGFIVRRGVSHV